MPTRLPFLPRRLYVIAPLCIFVACATHKHASVDFDLVIYGCTPAGIAAAIQAKRMEKSAVLICPERHVGGMTASGLGLTDSGRSDAIGGMAREFYRRVKKHYDDPAAWIFEPSSAFTAYQPNSDVIWRFEPHVAEQVFEEMLDEAGVPVLKEHYLDRERGVIKDGPHLNAIATLSGETFSGHVFVDATYEGDLMAAAGVSYAVGREANSTYGETINGVQTALATYFQFPSGLDPYVVPGRPESGLLPRIQAEQPAPDGTGDKRIQAYNFRMCLTDNSANRAPFPKPAAYDPRQYELLARMIDQGWREGTQRSDWIPNRKTDTNNKGPFYTDNIGMNYDYPEASYERRKQIVQEHVDYQQGLMWFLANDPRVPEAVRQTYSQWGLCADEYPDNGHWPHQLYVREGRRMVSDFVETEHHLRAQLPTPSSVGMGSYHMDSHHVQRYVDAQGQVRNEGDVEVYPGGPYPISYNALVPRKSEADNLLVPVAVSASHIAYGSIRMEPVFLILGQSAGTAAVLSINAGTAVQDLPYSLLRNRLVQDEQVISLPR